MNYHTLGKFLGPTDDEIKPAVFVNALMRATLDLSELSGEQLKSEIDDIELAHERLSKIIKRVTNGQA